jgi:hypothetical protein
MKHYKYLLRPLKKIQHINENRESRKSGVESLVEIKIGTEKQIKQIYDYDRLSFSVLYVFFCFFPYNIRLPAVVFWDFTRSTADC